MAITGTGAIEREQSLLMMQVNGIFYPLGEDNESMERTLNNTVSQTKNVLGVSKSKVTIGNQVTSISPYLVARDSAVAQELYEIDRKRKQLDELKYTFMEVSMFDAVGDDKFRAWTQAGKIDLKSWGGSAADGLAAPFDIVWEGERTYGTYDRATNTFAPDDGIDALTVVSTAGRKSTSTIVVVSPALSTGNHYVYVATAEAQPVTYGDDLTAWTALSAGSELTLSDTPQYITVAEVDAANKAVKAGSAEIIYG